MEVYAAHHKAQIIVIPGRYMNPTSMWSQTAKWNDWWHRDLKAYLLGGRHNIGRHLTVYGDISIQPTAVTPLTDLEVFAGEASAIYGHPKVQLQTVPTSKRLYPRIFATTGAVTRANYTKSKAGRKAAAHHVFGALVVEKIGDRFFLRQITAGVDGSFYDLGCLYTKNGVEQSPGLEALIVGDAHVDQIDKKALAATKEMIRELRPKRVVLHDVHDHRTRSHHDQWDPQKKIQKALGFAEDNVRSELDRAVDFVKMMSELAETFVVPSNHHEHLDRWLKSARIQDDPKNARLYHQLWLEWISRFEKDGEWCPAFELYASLKGVTGPKFLRRNQSLRVKGWELNFHGDKGINGAQSGGVATYAKIGTKTVIGHTHTPGIRDGATMAGMICEPDQGYNDLPSSWMQANVGLYPDGSRTLLFILEGKWHA